MFYSPTLLPVSKFVSRWVIILKSKAVSAVVSIAIFENQFKRASMSIYLEPDSALGHIFHACTTDQIKEFSPEKRGIRIHGHSTTLRLETAFWSVLEEMARNEKLSLGELVQKIHDTCLVANDKNLASCLRVICLKYINIYS
ncbi:MAG: putative DNA-binding ribbon-helix-helix protein [Gammaproteobacteria bacterium]